MRVSRRWFTGLLVALGLLPGVDRILLAHAHERAPIAVSAALPSEGGAGASSEGWLDCAACHARATLDALVFDAHPERHGAAPAAAPLPAPCSAPRAERVSPQPVRGPPLRIV